MMSTEKEPLIKHNPSLQRYYASLESRIGYRCFLGGTRHFGYYPPNTIWPFPITRALRRMEDHLYDSLSPPPRAQVLDAGCGVGHVAMHLARKGVRVHGIDVVSNHVKWARREIRANGLEKDVSVRMMDYHHLDGLPDASFNGVYTMETLVHATDPERALGEFFRVMKPGGSLALYEYDHVDLDRVPNDSSSKESMESMKRVNDRASMPANKVFSPGTLQDMLERRGFRDVVVADLSENVRPMARLFLVGYVPYLIICLLGLQAWFVNTQAAVEGYRVFRKRLWRYVAVTAKKPSNELDPNDRWPRERRVG